MINLKSIVEEALGLPEGSLKVKSQKIMVQVELDTSSTKKGCSKMYCGICGKIDDSHSIYCIKDGRSIHRICGTDDLCDDCRSSTKKEEK